MNELESIVRVGEVSSVNESDRTARVMFKDIGITSGWLKVIKSPPFIPKRHELQRTETASGGSGYGAYDEHYHEVIIKPWLPEVGDQVLCLFYPVFNGDGFILGAL